MELLQKRQYRKTLILFWAFFGFSSLGFAQSDDSYLIQLELNKANKLYETGRMDSAMVVLKRITSKKDFGDAGRLLKSEIFRLKALCAFYLKEDSLSTYHIDEMLVYSPFYKARESDPSEFLLKIKTARPLPRLSFGIRGGTNGTIARVEKRYSIFKLNEGQASTLSESYSVGAGLDAGLFLQYYAARFLSFSIEAELSRLSFNYSGTNNLEIVGPQRHSYRMNYDYFDVPVILGLHPLPRFLVKSSIFGGAFYRYLGSASKQIGETNFPYTINSNRIGYGLILGAAVSYDRRRTRFTLSYRFKYGFSLANNPQNRYVKTNISGIFILENYDIDNDMSLTTSSINLSIVYLSKFKVFRKKINLTKMANSYK
jgi:hypothetical protein